MVAAGRGEKNNDRVPVRNRRYKIKRYMLQPRNIDVRHNGRVVPRMVVRRQTLYPNNEKDENTSFIYLKNKLLEFFSRIVTLMSSAASAA